MHAHGFGILLGQGSKTAASADDCNSLARTDAALLQALVDRDTGAKDGRHAVKRTLLGNARHVSALDDGILLERAVDRVSRK